MGAKIFWIVIVLLFIGGNLVYFSPGKLEFVDANPKPTLTQLSTNKITDTLQKNDSTVGTGKEAQKGNTLTVHYRGTLSDGKEFDSSYSRNEPFTFELGAGNVIQGWDQGLVGMKEGGKRTLTIPPALGYGEAGSPPTIPPNATLTFEIELLKVE